MTETLLRPDVIALIFAGSFIGYVFGFVPGISGLTALALLTPVGLYLDSSISFYFYASILGASAFGGSVPAILIGIPGQGENLATTLDGFQMSRQGRGAEALAISAVASALGAFISVGFLLLALPVAKEIVLLFGPSERFWLIVLAFSMVIVITGADWVKGLMSVALGVVLSSIGRSIMTGEFRYTLGTVYLSNGLNNVSFLAIGVFAVAVVLDMISSPPRALSIDTGDLMRFRQLWTGALYVLRRPLALLRGALIGVIVGITPGIGPVTASFLSYLAAKTFSRTPERFGKGTPDGVLAPETANNAVSGGAAIPTLLLGIPGSLSWALLLSILVMYGIQPGPDLIIEHPGIVWGVIWGIVASNAIASGLGLLAALQLARVTRVKHFYISGVVLVTCMVGAYLISNNVWDSMIILVGGLFGYAIHHFDYGLLPFTLGFILGPILEKSFYLTMQVGYGTYSAFFGSTVSYVLIALGVAFISTGPWLRRRLWRRLG